MAENWVKIPFMGKVSARQRRWTLVTFAPRGSMGVTSKTILPLQHWLGLSYVWRVTTGVSTVSKGFHCDGYSSYCCQAWSLQDGCAVDWLAALPGKNRERAKKWPFGQRLILEYNSKRTNTNFLAISSKYGKFCRKKQGLYLSASSITTSNTGSILSMEATAIIF